MLSPSASGPWPAGDVLADVAMSIGSDATDGADMLAVDLGPTVVVIVVVVEELEFDTGTTRVLRNSSGPLSLVIDSEV